VPLSVRPRQKPRPATVTVTCGTKELKVAVKPLALDEEESGQSARVVASGVEVATTLEFPITERGRTAMVKLSVKNTGGTNRQILASVTEGGESFLVNHPHFLLSAGHFANVPVCFKPRGTRDFQDYRGTLRLVIGKEVVDVSLRGHGGTKKGAAAAPEPFKRPL